MIWVCLGVSWYFTLKGDARLKAGDDTGWHYLCASAVLTIGAAAINIFMGTPK